MTNNNLKLQHLKITDFARTEGKIGMLVNGQNLLKLNIESDETNRKGSRKLIEIKHLWKDETLRLKTIRYMFCGQVYRSYHCEDCGNKTIVHTNSCNLRICPTCCKKQYWRIRNRLWTTLEPYGYVRGRFRKFMLREITLTWEKDIRDCDLTKIITDRRKQINKLLNHYRRNGKIKGSIVVFETKRSTNDLTRIHIHSHIMVISSYISQNELSKKWEKISNNRIVWIQLRRTGQAIGYLLKHIYKPPEILPRDVPLFLKVFEGRRRLSTNGILRGIEYWKKNLTCDMAIKCKFCGHELMVFEVKSLRNISMEYLSGIG